MSEVLAPAAILVASDDPSTRARLSKALGEMQHRVALAHDGEECLRGVLATPPDLVVADLSKTAVGSVEVCRMLKSDEATRPIPLIVLIPRAQRERRVDAFEAGADEVLPKPISEPEILARVKTMLRFKRLDDESRRQRRVIDSLLMISTMCQGYADASTRMFSDFGRRVAELLRAEQVAVILGRRGAPPSVLSFWPMSLAPARIDALARCEAVVRVMRSAAPITVGADERDRQASLGLEGGFVGVPVLGFDGEVLGAVTAFGTPSHLRPESVRILLALAGRVGAEVQLRDHTERLEELVRERTHDLVEAKGALERSQTETILRLAQAAEFRDHETGNHLTRLSQFSCFLARAIGMDRAFVELLALASLMHDIGKIGIPDAVLLKPGALTPAEREVMKRHTVFGAQICRGSDAPLLQMCERIALSHHEWWNGQGYPQGLRGEAIPAEARLVAVADVFDALISRRHYKEPWPIDRAFDHLAELAGTHLDPALVTAFLDVRGAVSEIAGRLADAA